MNPVLWRAADLHRFLAMLAAALGALLLGWWGSAQKDGVGNQVGWSIVALLGVTVATLGCAKFLATAYRTITVRRAEVLGTLRTTGISARLDTALGSAPAPPLVALPAMAYFHRADCPFVAGKAAPAASRDDHVAAGRQPCPGCQP